MATTNMITSLSEALLRAKAYASMLYGGEEDGGTSNFDTPQLILVGWTEADVESAFLKAELPCYIKRSGNVLVVDVLGCTSGQGSRRTRMAEAVRYSLAEDGYDAYVYYQMD